MEKNNILSKELFHVVGESENPLPPQPSAEPNWISYPLVANHIDEVGTFADIVNHYKHRLTYPSRKTNAHETCHMIHSEIRNKFRGDKRIAGFYAFNNRACIMEHPNIAKRQVIPFVPNELKGLRYSTYVAGQNEWDDSPLYLYDEWQCYIAGSFVCVEDVHKGIYKDGWTDGVMGVLEFSIYALALILAIQKHDPNYFSTTPDFMKYTAWCLNASYDVYKRGSVMKEFKWDRQDNLLQLWRTSLEANPMRDILRNNFNNVWMV